jgi:adenylosuccinate lyase
LWHERDISHSSVERVILPDSTIALDHMLQETVRIVRELEVNEKQLAVNLELTGGLIYSQRVLLALVESGLARETAYDLVQGYALQAWESGQRFSELLRQDRVISEKLDEQKLKECFDPAYYLKRVDYIYRRLGL